MIVQEDFTIGQKMFRKFYSNLGYMIEQVETGERYSEAIDIYPFRYTYIEITGEPYNA